MSHPKSIASAPLLVVLCAASAGLALAVPGAGVARSAGEGNAADEEGWSQDELERVTATIQKEIEDLRGLRFKRPVAVELSDKERFLAHATERMEELTPEGKMEGDQDIARHLGMIPHDMDLLQVTMDLLAEQVGGFYSPASQAFFLMPSFTGDLARVILAHELTHALDDQHFDLDGGFKRALSSTDASTAYASVVEGSGTQLMTRWLMRHLGDLSPEALEAAGAMGGESLSTAPPYVWLPLIGIYIKGQAFLNSGYSHDKQVAKTSGTKADINASLDRAFASPPRSSEQILHPDKYWAADERDEPRALRHVLTPEKLQGWTELQRDVLGELVLGILTTPFDQRSAPDLNSPTGVLGLRFTNVAATGWGGDEVLLLGKEDARLVHLATCWDTEQDADEFLEAVRGLESGLLENLRALAGGDPQASGLRIEKGGSGDQVLVCAWSGASEAEVRAVAQGLSVVEGN